MPRLLVLIPLLTWLAAEAGQGVSKAGVVATWLGCLAVPVTVWVASSARARAMDRFRMTPAWARRVTTTAVPTLLVIFGLGCYVGTWPTAVARLVGDDTNTLGTLLGTMPAYLAWASLVAAEWPLLRRRHAHLAGEPEAAPTFARWWLAELRPTLLVTLAPLLVFWIIKDAAAAALAASPVSVNAEVTAALLTGIAVASALLVGPVVVRRVLPTDAINDDEGPGGRLYDLVRRTDLRRPAGLLRVWHTGGSVINALAVGIVPRWRYVLLSDLLLRSLPVDQVEAVLAHELGHLRHRHVAWFVFFFVAASLATIGPIDLAYGWVVPVAEDGSTVAIDGVVAVVLLVFILGGFVLLSRLFERQADVFAARLIGPTETVSATGAWAFAQALRAAVQINGPPPMQQATPGLVPRLQLVLRRQADLMHGSPRSRCDYLMWLADDPTRTASFEKRVGRVKLGIVVTAAISLPFVV